MVVLTDGAITFRNQQLAGTSGSPPGRSGDPPDPIPQTATTASQGRPSLSPIRTPLTRAAGGDKTIPLPWLRQPPCRAM